MLSDPQKMGTSEMTTRILLVDDHEFVRQGAKQCLEREAGFEVVGEVDDGLQVVPVVEELRPDVVVLDHSLPGLNGIDVAQKISRKTPETKVIMLSMHTDEAYVVRALSCGVRGYVTKGAASEELVTAIRCVMQGKRYLSSPHSNESLDNYMRRASSRKFSPYETLTPREREVAQLVVEGFSSKRVGERLFISERTVESHRRRIRDKFGSKSTAELVAAILHYQSGSDDS